MEQKLQDYFFFMPENASFQVIVHTNFRASLEKWVLTLKEISSHIFKLVFYFKFLWGFHGPHNQVNTAKKMKLFPELFINKMFEHTFVIFVSNQSLFQCSVGYYSYSRGELWCAATDFIFHFEYRRNFLYYFAQDCSNTSLIAIYHSTVS